MTSRKTKTRQAELESNIDAEVYLRAQHAKTEHEDANADK